MTSSIRSQDATTRADYAALILRLSLGVMFVAHAWLKYAVFTPAGTAGYFVSVGLPGWLAVPTIAAELIGGVLLILGVQTRVVAAALTPVLAGALAFGHATKGWVFSGAGGGWEYPAFLIAASVVQVLLGDGAHALRFGRRKVQGVRAVTA